MMHRRTRAAAMTWNAYYRDKMNRSIGIRVADSHRRRREFARGTFCRLERGAVALSGCKNRSWSHLLKCSSQEAALHATIAREGRTFRSATLNGG